MTSNSMAWEVPYPCNERDAEKGPLTARNHAQKGNGVRRRRHRRLETAESACYVLGGRHAMVRRMVLLDLSAVAAVVGAIDTGFLRVGGHVCENSFARVRGDTRVSS